MIDELKNKVEEIKKKERELDIAIQTISILKPLFNEVSLSVQDKIQTNSISIIQETVKEVGEGIKNKLDFTELSEKLQKQSEAIENIKDKEIIKELQLLITSVSELSNKSVYNNEILVQTFDKSLHNILNILTKANEIPNKTEYKRSGDKISQVVESYNTYTLTHKWVYDKNENLIKVTTTKDETP